MTVAETRPGTAAAAGGEAASTLAFLGVRPIVNAAGPLMRLGGCALAPAVVAARAEAAESALKLSELQAAAGAFIAEVTGRRRAT